MVDSELSLLSGNCILKLKKWMSPVPGRNTVIGGIYLVQTKIQTVQDQDWENASSRAAGCVCADSFPLWHGKCKGRGSRHTGRYRNRNASGNTDRRQRGGRNKNPASGPVCGLIGYRRGELGHARRRSGYTGRRRRTVCGDYRQCHTRQSGRII